MRWGWLALGFVGCTLLHRAQTYPRSRDVTSVEWYKPMAPVAGAPETMPKHAPVRLTSAAIAEIEAYAAARNTAGLVVMEDGAIVHEWYAPGFDASKSTNSMSMAKTVLALLVGIAVADGKITSVEDSVSTYLPEFRRGGRERITIRHLLEMTSGLRNREELKLGTDLVTYMLGTHIERRVLSIPVEVPPGTTFDYNNGNSILLGMVLEKVYGKSYESLTSERLWKPLGAGNAEMWLDRKKGMPRVFCCMFAVPQDWARVGQLILDEGRVGITQVVPSEWIAQMSQPSLNNPEYGWQLWLTPQEGGGVRKATSEAYLDPKMVFLSGYGEQKTYVLPSAGVVVVRVGEQPEEWDDSFIPNTVMRGLVK